MLQSSPKLLCVLTTTKTQTAQPWQVMLFRCCDSFHIGFTSTAFANFQIVGVAVWTWELIKLREQREDDVRLTSGLSSDQSGNLFSHRCQHVLMIVELGQTVPP